MSQGYGRVPKLNFDNRPPLSEYLLYVLKKYICTTFALDGLLNVIVFKLV